MDIFIMKIVFGNGFLTECAVQNVQNHWGSLMTLGFVRTAQNSLIIENIDNHTLLFLLYFIEIK